MRVWRIKYLAPKPPAFYKDEPYARVQAEGPLVPLGETVEAVERDAYEMVKHERDLLEAHLESVLEVSPPIHQQDDEYNAILRQGRRLLSRLFEQRQARSY